MHTKRPYVDGNPIPGLGQAQTCGVGVKEVNRIPTFTLLTIRFPMAYIQCSLVKLPPSVQSVVWRYNEFGDKLRDIENRKLCDHMKR